ncbi:hypothetical protein RHEC894_PE00275 (plasmid) [Rhizobium sp. CIAT894]|nr:hypothetical protein RHEC894_PE00275 [Rhizobium sp. CIAT894]
MTGDDLPAEMKSLPVTAGRLSRGTAVPGAIPARVRSGFARQSVKRFCRELRKTKG